MLKCLIFLDSIGMQLNKKEGKRRVNNMNEA